MVFTLQMKKLRLKEVKVTDQSLAMDRSLDFEFRPCGSRMDALNHSTRLHRLKLALPQRCDAEGVVGRL